MKREYSTTGRIGKAALRDAARELTRLERERGHLTAAIVVDAARSAKSPLHRHFEWDDSRAAEMHRREQARLLIRTVNVQIVGRKTPGEPVRAFVAVVDSKSGDTVYKQTLRVLKNDEERRQILGRAHDELVSWRDRYKALEEFAGVFDAIDVVDRSIERSLKVA